MTKLRVALVGVSHWHTSFYLDPLLAMSDQVQVCGISDPDPEVVARFRARVGCAGSTDYRDMCRSLKPDFVVALGRHCDMAETARFLIDENIPLALEKPCGMNAAQVAEIAAHARAKSAFAAVALVMRHGPFVQRLEDILSREDATYASFRFIAGSASRYLDNGCAWMLDPKQSGGGCTINLGVHFFDIAQRLLGPDCQVVSSTMSNQAWHYPVEDYSAVTIRSGQRSVLIETGYLYPAPTNHFDMHYAVRTPERYLTAWGASDFEIREYAGGVSRHAESATNVPHYLDFTRDVLQRLAKGKEPLAGLDAMLASMRLIDQAYAMRAPLPAV
jgi:predicted dehydrogenase